MGVRVANNRWNFYRTGIAIASANRSIEPIQSLDPRLQGVVAQAGQDAPPTEGGVMPSAGPGRIQSRSLFSRLIPAYGGWGDGVGGARQISISRELLSPPLIAPLSPIQSLDPRLQGVVAQAGQGRSLSRSLFSRLIPAYKAWRRTV